MKYIDPSFKLIELPLLEKIELAGRVCYQSEDKIKEGVDITFIQNICKRGHTSVLEHSGIYFTMDLSITVNLRYVLREIEDAQNIDLLPFIKFKKPAEGRQVLVSTNLRLLHTLVSHVNSYGIIKNLLLGILREFPELEPFILIDKSQINFYTPIDVIRVEDAGILNIETFNIVCDRAIQNELVRHRTMSFSVESTRYCNYSKDKFNNEISIITPETMVENSLMESIYHEGCTASEIKYFDLLEAGCTAQIARKALPLGLKTEFYMSGYVFNWNKVFKLRSVSGAHPEVRVISQGINQALNKKYGDLVPII